MSLSDCSVFNVNAISDIFMFNDGFFFHPGKFICFYECDKLSPAECLSMVFACYGPIVYCHLCIFRSVRQHNIQIANSRREQNERVNMQVDETKITKLLLPQSSHSHFVGHRSSSHRLSQKGGYNMFILFVRPCVNETPIGDVYWAAINPRFASQIHCTVLNWEDNQRQIVHSLKGLLTRTSSSFCETEAFHQATVSVRVA